MSSDHELSLTLADIPVGDAVFSEFCGRPRAQTEPGASEIASSFEHTQHSSARPTSSPTRSIAAQTYALHIFQEVIALNPVAAEHPVRSVTPMIVDHFVFLSIAAPFAAHLKILAWSF
jgi:hypothetical protein